MRGQKDAAAMTAVAAAAGLIAAIAALRYTLFCTFRL
jgi:hypothetical protein